MIRKTIMPQNNSKPKKQLLKLVLVSATLILIIGISKKDIILYWLYIFIIQFAFKIVIKVFRC